MIGTAALREPDFLDAMLIELTASASSSRSTRATARCRCPGWTETSDVDVAEAVAELAERGVERFLCTAIEVDGTMAGPALDQLREIAAATPAQVIASGGVGSLADLEAVAALGAEAANVEGVIVGRALYEGRFTVAEGIAALST